MQVQTRSVRPAAGPLGPLPGNGQPARAWSPAAGSPALHFHARCTGRSGALEADGRHGTIDCFVSKFALVLKLGHGCLAASQTFVQLGARQDAVREPACGL